MAAAGKSGDFPAWYQDLPAWYKELEKDLECPVCLIAFLDPPIYVCENQHGLCSPCRTKLNDQGKPCPVCNGKLTDKRCMMMEKLLDKLPKTKCIYPECSFQRCDPQAVLDHQEDCIHRIVECGNCGEMWAMSSLNQHLETQHDREFYRAVQPKWVWEITFMEEGQWMMLGPQNTTLENVSFYYNAVVLDDKNTMEWISYNGPKKDRKKYQFSIEVLSTEDPMKVVFSCTKFCVPCDISHEDVKGNHLGVIINKGLVQEVNTEADDDLNKLTFDASIQVFLTKSF